MHSKKSRENIDIFIKRRFIPHETGPLLAAEDMMLKIWWFYCGENDNVGDDGGGDYLTHNWFEPCFRGHPNSIYRALYMLDTHCQALLKNSTAHRHFGLCVLINNVWACSRDFGTPRICDASKFQAVSPGASLLSYTQSRDIDQGLRQALGM